MQLFIGSVIYDWVYTSRRRAPNFLDSPLIVQDWNGAARVRPSPSSSLPYTISDKLLLYNQLSGEVSVQIGLLASNLRLTSHSFLLPSSCLAPLFHFIPRIGIHKRWWCIVWSHRPEHKRSKVWGWCQPERTSQRFSSILVYSRRLVECCTRPTAAFAVDIVL